MNLPNKLTIFRIILTPVFMALLVIDFPCHYIFALFVFIVASLTDMADGKIARKYNLVTDFGKFLDPLADKMLTTAALLAFIRLDICYGMVWIVFIVMLREFLIASLRLVAVGNGKVIAANMWGKVKTVSQMAAIIFTIVVLGALSFGAVQKLACFATVEMVAKAAITVALWISTVLTVISGVVYMLQNGKYLNSSK